MSLAAPSEALLEERIAKRGVCVHCGTVFARKAEPTEFCCAGCEFVHGLIVDSGLERFYDLRDSAVLPVKSLVFQKRDYRWLEDLAAAAPGLPARLTLELQGVSCIGCVWLIERLFLRRSGAVSAGINSALGQVTLRWVPRECDLMEFARELQGFGYLLGPPGERKAAPQRAFAIRLGVCGAFALNAMLFSVPRYLGMQSTFTCAALFDRLALAFATLSFCVGGSYFFQRTWSGARRGMLHIDLPISVGLAAAYAGSILAWSRDAMNFAYFDFVSTFTFLMLAGRWMQQRAIERNRSRLLGMQTDLTVTLPESGKQLPAREIVHGAHYCIEPGQVVPVRSKLFSEAATLGLDWINGEPETRAARCGQLVSAGSVNCTQTSITLEAAECWEDSLLNALLNEKPREKGASAPGGRFIKWYVVIVLSLAVLGFWGWALAGRPLLMAWQVLVSTLVVSCPCASGVALPLADELAASRLRRRGVFVREQGLWSRLARVRKILFDKTGTLTLETMELRDPGALAGLSPGEKSVLLALVQDNLHPASCCLRELLMAARVQPANMGAVREETGQGIKAFSDDSVFWRLGQPEWAGTKYSDGEGCVLSRGGVAIAHFHFHEQARPGARQEIDWLQNRGYTVFILSGDGAEKVESMAVQLGLPSGRCIGGMSPRAKQDFVRQLDENDTLMIGDGANDSLAFNESWCTGTPAIDRGLLQSKSDFYFVGRGLGGIRHLLLVAEQRRKTARCVIGFAIAYNIAAITLCMAGRMNPVLAAVLMPASSVAALALVAMGLKEPRRTS